MLSKEDRRQIRLCYETVLVDHKVADIKQLLDDLDEKDKLLEEARKALREVHYLVTKATESSYK